MRFLYLQNKENEISYDGDANNRFIRSTVNEIISRFPKKKEDETVEIIENVSFVIDSHGVIQGAILKII